MWAFFGKDALLSSMCIQDVGQFWFICFFLVAIRHRYGSLVAQILETGADRPSTIVPFGMWAR